MDVNELLKLLNGAYASEWLAYYQYWLGAKVLKLKGPMKDAVAAELNLHATEELNHATLLATRIVQLAGTPIADPHQWSERAHAPTMLRKTPM
jgi:bacterioferritin